MSEVKYYGLHACLELTRKRPDDTIRAYLTQDLLPKFKPYLQRLASTKRAYHIVSSDELEKITQSVHHEGVCILTREVPLWNTEELLRQISSEQLDLSRPLVYLAQTGNPHNIGAILRSAAHFGVRYVLADADKFPRIAGSLARISKGGCEHVRLVKMERATDTLKTLQKQGFQLVTTNSRAKESVFTFQWPKKCVLAFGHESTGLPQTIRQLSSREIVVPGSGLVESLNVSVAAGIVFSTWASGMP